VVQVVPKIAKAPKASFLCISTQMTKALMPMAEDIIQLEADDHEPQVPPCRTEFGAQNTKAIDSMSREEIGAANIAMLQAATTFNKSQEMQGGAGKE
jgi:hypothetical protein